MGKYVDFLRLHGFGLMERFGVMMWIPLLALCTPVYRTLIRLFYCKENFFEIGAKTSIKSLIRGIEIEINGDKICEILGIPPMGARGYDTKLWP